MTANKEPEVPAKKNIPFWLILILLTMFGFALLGERGALRAFQSLRHKQGLELQLSDLQEQQKVLRTKIQLLESDPDHWEQLARKELGMVREGELIYQFPTDD